jgi:hypothetical protein
MECAVDKNLFTNRDKDCRICMDYNRALVIVIKQCSFRQFPAIYCYISPVLLMRNTGQVKTQPVHTKISVLNSAENSNVPQPRFNNVATTTASLLLSRFLLASHAHTRGSQI